MKHSLVPPLECCHADTCLPDYWAGSASPHCSIFIYPEMCIEEIKKALHKCLNDGDIGGSDDRILDNSGEVGDVWYYRAHAAVNRLRSVSRARKFFLEAPEDAGVYAYFVFKDR